MDEFDEAVEVFCCNLRLLLVNGDEKFQKEQLTASFSWSK